MPCAKCNADFNLLNWKLKCMECEESHCSKCLKKHEGCYFCDVCTILVQRPPNRDHLMELKPKDLQQYLNKYKVPTHGLVEKHELVDLFWRYHIPVDYKKSHRNKLLNLTGSVPNLAARSQCYLNNLKSNAEAVINRNLWPPSNGVFSETPSPTRPNYQQHREYHNRPPPQFGNQSRQQSNGSGNNSPTSPQPSVPPPDDIPPPPAKKYPELSDFESEEELSDLSVKQLKELLTLNRVNYKGCVEKNDLLQLALTLWKNVKESDTVNVESNQENCCKICMDAPLDCVLLECGHIATCIQCGKQLAECPICRQYITRVVRTFKV